MANLRSALRKLRVQNHERHFFIPGGSLDAIINPQVVHHVLKACQVPAWDIQAIQTTILNGAQKTFAILVLIKQESEIGHFIKFDDFQDQTLDSKLPFPRDQLERIIPQYAEEFFEQQWLFTAPIFARQRIHRYFSDDTVLPFTSLRSIGQGGFGQVHEVTLPWKHQRYFENSGNNVTGVRLAKKELDVETGPDDHPADAWEATGASEHAVLAILHHLEHPNILELLASYTHRGKHNLIFPLATGGDLQSFLLGFERPEELRHDHAIYAALAGLSSALASLHEFKSSTFDMELMGFHHDLKPKNVLVSGARFILSDFGLSKLEARDTSKTEFKIGRGYYLAPECENLLDRFKKGTITRASDVWSFGCILLEVLIYMRFGTDGIHEFREERRYEVGNFITRSFFTPSGLNPAVTSWAEKISAPTEDIVLRRALSLALKTLRLPAQDRLRADQLTTGLRLTTIHSLYNMALKDIQNLVSARNTYDIRVELQRYEAWGSIFDFDLTSINGVDNTEAELFHNTLIFEDVAKSLQAMNEVASRCSTEELGKMPVHFQVRAINDALFRQLDWQQLKRAHHRLEAWLISSAEETDFGVAGTSGLLYIDQGLVKVAKQMHALTTEQNLPSTKDRRIARDLLQNLHTFQACHTATYHPSADELGLNVLIEWIVYDVHWTDAVGVQLFSRINALIELLSSPSNAAHLRILPCRGYFHAPDRRAFGLVYELPLPSAQPGRGFGDIFSLREFIQTTQDVRQRPLLGDLFKLAYSLANSLSSMHKAGWLHKALTPSNIIFIIPDSSRHVLNLAGDYRIVGFNHSRPDNPKEYTEAAWKRSAESRLYQHPNYLNNLSRSCAEYDYYSFGLLLLELGLWKSLSSMVTRPESKEEAVPQVEGSSQLTKYLVERRVPLLGPKMGKRYRDAVSFCLNTELGVTKGLSQDCRQTDVQIEFERRVIQPLGRCEL